jgi:polar amino acid transport system substrate-binding protein
LKNNLITLFVGTLWLFSTENASFAQTKSESILNGTTIQFCGDGAGWPPYTFFERKNDVKTNNIVGYDLDVVKKILSPLGIKSNFSMPPWRRCMVLTNLGEKYQVALSSSFSAERAETYLMSQHYYHTTVNYFYDRSRFKTPPSIKLANDLFKHGLVCGLHGYNYEGTGVFTNEFLDLGSKDLKSIIQRTLARRCTFFLFRSEIFNGFKLIGNNSIEFNKVAFRPVPKAKIDKFYMLISRNYKHAASLKKILDQGIMRLRKTGELNKILNSYIGKKVN